MQLRLKSSKVDEFEKKMAALAPWMHAYQFDESILVGYFKYHGLGESVTFCNRQTGLETVQRMREAYASIDHSIPRAFFKKVINRLAGLDRSQAVVLDISGATGEKSIWCVQEGFGHVISSEIRKNQCDQQSLIYACLDDDQFQARIEVRNDLISADDPAFVDLYRGQRLDVVMSWGLLYHLTNPIQHLKNLYTLTSRYAVMQTLTHYSPFRKGYWELNFEDPKWITKAVASISWTPHYLDVISYAQQVGFKRVELVYPDAFEKNFPDFKRTDKTTRLKLASELALKKLGIRMGHQKNFDLGYFKRTGLNPNYFTYIFEK